MTVASVFEATELPQLLNDTNLLPIFPPGTREEDIPAIDLTPVKHFDLTVCLGKEWHRFPGHFLVPSGVRVKFIKSAFDGQLPRHFEDFPVNGSWWPRPATRYIPEDVNDLNKEDLSRYVCQFPVLHVPFLICWRGCRYRWRLATTWSTSTTRYIPLNPH